MVLAVTALRAMLVVTVTPEGIRCGNAIGWPHFVRWASIRDVQYHGERMVPYLLFSSSDRWTRSSLPLYLENVEECLLLIVEYAGPKNPIAAWFLSQRNGASGFRRSSKRLYRGGSQSRRGSRRR